MSTRFTARVSRRVETFTLSSIEKRAISQKRKSNRVAHDSTMQVAPYDGAMIPAAEEYQSVVTRDLSPTGVSFYAPAEPTTVQIVLMIGDRRQPIYITARIVRSQLGYYQGKRQYLVGCAFTGRFRPD